MLDVALIEMWIGFGDPLDQFRFDHRAAPGGGSWSSPKGACQTDNRPSSLRLSGMTRCRSVPRRKSGPMPSWRANQVAIASAEKNPKLGRFGFQSRTGRFLSTPLAE